MFFRLPNFSLCCWNDSIFDKCIYVHLHKGSLFPGKIGKTFEPIMTMMWCICVSDSDASVFHLAAFSVRGCGFGCAGCECGCIVCLPTALDIFIRQLSKPLK